MICKKNPTTTHWHLIDEGKPYPVISSGDLLNKETSLLHIVMTSLIHHTKEGRL